MINKKKQREIRKVTYYEKGIRERERESVCVCVRGRARARVCERMRE